ncbi:hypothetical protein HPB48_001653 [Haemaphysalis longicornis]|uniref:THAP-type domain-containing protein n=1 Tax=Haemaphysalis longicornis TaxID=44386 RepID=A0A9J6GV13_HAELO|nr:hypothetical protein HPB48_001653 [Haemaphysalis longicornis]
MSGVRCSVDFCPSHTGSGASMYRFPLGDGPRRQKWIEFVRGAAGRTEWTPRKSSRIFSLHFEPACYKQDLPNVLLPRPLCCLEPDAVPSIYNVVGPDSEHSSLSKRPRLEVRIACVLLACVWCHKYIMTPNIVQALADIHPEDAASSTIWAGPSADCGVNEVEKAADYVARLFSLLEEYVRGATPNALPVKPPHVTSALVSVDKAALVKTHLTSSLQQTDSTSVPIALQYPHWHLRLTSSSIACNKSSSMDDEDDTDKDDGVDMENSCERTRPLKERAHVSCFAKDVALKVILQARISSRSGSGEANQCTSQLPHKEQRKGCYLAVTRSE